MAVDKNTIHPATVNSWRKMAGLPAHEFTTYYNYAGDHAGEVEGRINMEPVFYVKMTKENYHVFEETHGTEERSYLRLLEMI